MSIRKEGKDATHGQSRQVPHAKIQPLQVCNGLYNMGNIEISVSMFRIWFSFCLRDHFEGLLIHGEAVDG